MSMMIVWPPEAEALRQALDEWRKREGMLHKDLAVALRYEPESWSRLWNRRRPPSKDLCARVIRHIPELSWWAVETLRVLDGQS